MCSVLPCAYYHPKYKKPIGKTDIYNVLVAGGYLPTTALAKHKKNKSEGWEKEIY